MLRRGSQKKPLSAALQAHFETPEGKEALRKHFSTPEGKAELTRAANDEIRRAHPRLLRALPSDVDAYSERSEPGLPRTQLEVLGEAVRLCGSSSSFLTMLLYRARTRMLAHDLPLLPHVLHRLCMALTQVDIGTGVVIEPGVHIPHGQIVIDGKVVIGTGTIISPWVTLGRNGAALEGPTIGRNVFVGTGAMILGPLKIGDHSRICANAVVLRDVEPHTTVGGVPARVMEPGSDDFEPPGIP